MGWSRWSRAFTSAGLVSVAACTALAGTPAGGAAPLRDGPLESTSAHAWAIGKPVGETFTDGLEALEFAGAEPAKLVRVRMLGDEGLELVGVGLATPERRFGSVQLMDGFPPTHRDLTASAVLEDGFGVPLAGSTRAGIGWELLLGIRAREPGRLVRTGIEVTYTVGEETYVEVIPAALAVCASPSNGTPTGDCKMPPLPDGD